jgi:hypothetical protein
VSCRLCWCWWGAETWLAQVYCWWLHRLRHIALPLLLLLLLLLLRGLHVKNGI